MLNIYWSCFCIFYFHFPLAGGGCFPLQNQSFLRKTSGRGSALGVGRVRGLRNNLPVAIRCQMDGCTGSADRWQRLPHGHSLSWCLHVSSRPLRKQEQLACLSLLAGESGACTPKLESRHRTRGEVGWKGPWSDPSLKVGPDSGWDQALAQDFAQPSCEFLLRVEFLVILWASGQVLGNPRVK